MTSSNTCRAAATAAAMRRAMAEVSGQFDLEDDDADVHAIAVYLKDLPTGAPDLWRARRRSRTWRRVRRLCRACIAATKSARRRARIYPPLPGNANLQSADPTSTLRIILGRRPDGDDAAHAQYRLDAGLCQGFVGPADRRRRHLHSQFVGNAAPAVTPEQVANARKASDRR